MFQVIWELKVRFSEREKIEQFYGPKGDWVKFFSSSPNYQGTEILESNEGDNVFLVIDEWTSEESFNEFVNSRNAGFNLLEEKAGTNCRSKQRIRIAP